MRKLFLVVSILFLTVYSYAKDFTIPIMAQSYDVVKWELSKKYEIDSTDDNYISYKTDNVFYANRKLISLMLINTAEKDSYAIVLVFQDMSSNEWINTIFTIMQNENLVILPEKLEGDFIFRKEENTGNLMAAYTFKEDMGYKTFAIIKN